MRCVAPGCCRIPAHWPLRHVPSPTASVNLALLSRAFYDQHVMIKMQVTRSTLPREKDEGAFIGMNSLSSLPHLSPFGKTPRSGAWLPMPGNAGLKWSTRVLKQSLLEQCGIGYWQ